MTRDEAHKIFKSWKGYVEINDKMGAIFTKLPKSFLPYSQEKIEEALNIVAKEHFEIGDKKMFDTIQVSLITLMDYEDDEDALNSMLATLKLMDKNRELKDTYLKLLEKTSKSWERLK